MDQLWTEKEDILNKVLDALEVKYPSGLYDWLYSHDRDLYDRIDEIEDQLNESFRNGSPVDEFKRLLRDYWTAHMQGIRLFKAGGQPEPSPEVRQARIQERESAHV
jgi:hypothetical protein